MQRNIAGTGQQAEHRIADFGLGFEMWDVGFVMWNTVYRSPFTIYDLNDFNDLNGFDT